MDQTQAKKDAEALRYRLIVRLALVAREADAQGRPDVAAFARTMRSEVEAIRVGRDPAVARKALLAFLPKVEKLHTDVGLPDHGVNAYPKWMRFAGWATPVVLLVGLIGLIIERRRRKREVTDDAIKALDAQNTTGKRTTAEE